jgi:hypothetical protein
VDEVCGEVPVRLLQPPVPRHAGFPCRGPGEGSVTVHFPFFSKSNVAVFWICRAVSFWTSQTWIRNYLSGSGSFH